MNQNNLIRNEGAPPKGSSLRPRPATMAQTPMGRMVTWLLLSAEINTAKANSGDQTGFLNALHLPKNVDRLDWRPGQNAARVVALARQELRELSPQLCKLSRPPGL